MKNPVSHNSLTAVHLACRATLRSQFVTILALGLTLWLPARVPAAESGKVFGTPEQAVAALSAAVVATNRAAFDSLFGTAAKQLVNPDEVQGAAELSQFAEAFSTTNRLVRESDARSILYVGPNDWPFPIPLIKLAGGWQFDAEAGLAEVLNRRIGRNELEVLSTLRACVEAQRDYASKDRDGDEVLEYAQRFASSDGQTDGLYWPTELNGEVSPLGPLVADAQGEGYFNKSSKTRIEPLPFHGYFFKMFTRQGKNAPGGKYDHVINGNMIGGFGFVAWPAEYGESGIMTFIVNQQGRVYQRDLGKETARTVKKLKAYDPDKNWQISAD